jgi:hypothetical protein
MVRKKILTGRRRNWKIMYHVRGLFEKFVDWWQCAAVMQREAVTVMPSCGGVT